MAAGGTGGMKYTIQMDIQANTKAVEDLTRNVDQLSRSLIALQKQSAQSAKNLSGGLASANAQGYFLASTLERAGHQSLFFAKTFAAATAGSFTTLLHEAANLEQYIIRLQSTQGTTKQDALDIFNYTIKATTHLPITEAQLVRVATTFKQRGMDIREAFHGKTYEDIIRSGHAVEGLAGSMANAGKEGVGLLDLFSDLATTQGQLATEDVGKFVREFSEFMATGQTRFLRTRLDPVLLHELNSTKANAGKAMDVIYEYLAKRNALGVSRLSMQTFSGVITNFKGLPQRIANAVFQPGLAEGMARKFSLALGKAFETINEYFDESTEKGKRFLPELRKIFDFIGGAGIAAVNGLTRAFQRMADFMIENPGFAKFATMVTTVFAGLMALKGVMFLFRGTLITIAMAGKLLEGVTTLLNISTGFLVIKYGALIAVGGLLFAMFRKVGTVISAVHEAMTNYDPKKGIWTISRKTYDELQKGGMVGLFEKILSLGLKLQGLFEGDLSLEQTFPVLAALRDFLKSLGDGFLHVVDVILGDMSPALDKNGKSMSTAGTNSSNLTQTIERVAKAGSEMAKVFSESIPQSVATAVEWFADLIDTVDNMIIIFLRAQTAIYAAAAGLLAFTNPVAAAGFAVKAAMSAGADAAYMTYGPERGEDRKLKLTGKLRQRAYEIKARGTADIVAEERGALPPSSEMAGYRLVEDPERGVSYLAPIHGVQRDANQAGVASWASASGAAQSFDPRNMGAYDPMAGSSEALRAISRQKIVVDNRVYIDGRSVATSSQTHQRVEADRAGDTTMGGPEPMMSSNATMHTYPQ